METVTNLGSNFWHVFLIQLHPCKQVSSRIFLMPDALSGDSAQPC